VGLLPLCAVTVVEKWQRERVSKLTDHMFARLRRMPELAASILRWSPEVPERSLLAG
jgi:hypothetical protein